jgi:hypothetical protein
MVANIRQGNKCLSVTNPLAYHTGALITTVKMFIVNALKLGLESQVINMKNALCKLNQLEAYLKKLCGRNSKPFYSNLLPFRGKRELLSLTVTFSLV